MKFTPEQIKGRIQNTAKINNADPQTLMRLFMMERFLERLANSKYKDNFIIKGGVLVCAMVGLGLRSTMDIDTSVRNLNLTPYEAKEIINNIINIDLHDGVTFKIKKISGIMDKMEYPGVRFSMDAKLGSLITPINIDISTGDAITPRAIEYQYKLLLDDHSIKLWSYNLETILAEKLQTILARGIYNTRMRDFYDVKTLLSLYKNDIDKDLLKKAFHSTCSTRGTDGLKEKRNLILTEIEKDETLQRLWESYRKKYFYSAGIDYLDVINSIRELLTLI